MKQVSLWVFGNLKESIVSQTNPAGALKDWEFLEGSYQPDPTDFIAGGLQEYSPLSTFGVFTRHTSSRKSTSRGFLGDAEGVQGER